MLLKTHFLRRPMRTIRTLKLWHFATFILKVTPQRRVLTVTFPTVSANKITQWLCLLQLRTNIFIEKKMFTWSNITKWATHTASNLYNIFSAQSCICNRKKHPISGTVSILIFSALRISNSTYKSCHEQFNFIYINFV